MTKRELYINFLATGKFEECDYYFKLVLRRAVLATLEHEGVPFAAEVSITLCDNEYIRELNKKHRNKDSATDVLSFPLYDFTTEELYGEEEVVSLGDIVISLERAKEQAKEIGHTFLEEVAFLAIHSTLHLLGYDHERSPEDDEAQCSAQREIIATVEI
ncbi:MAG: rRNA maturation RNase YbeY [Clostridia bacterium]|nr:rRNA maturation RNase YbeY [Clostridia bacterium]